MARKEEAQQLPQLSFTQARDEVVAEVLHDLAMIQSGKVGRRFACKLGLIGPPGVGKSSCVMDVPRVLKEKHDVDCDILTFFLPARDPTDQTGLPMGRWVQGENGEDYAVVEFAKAMEIVSMYNATRPLLVNWDELAAAAPSVQNSSARLLGGDAFNATRISPYVSHVWTGNAMGHKAGAMGVMSHIAGRTQMVAEFRPIIDDPDGYGLVQYFVKQDYDPWLIAYMRAFGHRDDAGGVNIMGNDLNKDGRKSADPRSIEAMALKIKRGQFDVSILSTCAGLPFVTAFLEWRQIATKIPDWKDIISKPAETALPDERQPGVMYALASSLVYHVSANNIDAICTYLNRLKDAGHGEFGVYWAKDVLQRKDGQKLAATPAFRKWSLDNAHLFGVRVS